ncbi:Receptor-like protein kinase FERONIA [Acorus calamus]|uniref:Receptor-like protein kinase FERONIA n=1 Tax=Acorus calamus TaxID=4465 RepID=A0AAV9C5H9_ACOCL|nr:Receptor-like protein kinase FERONIA [Acorus calamus]
MKIHLRNQPLFSLLLSVTIIASIDPTSAQNFSTTYVPADKSFLNCGVPTLSATPSIQDPSIPTVPYMTARIFKTPYTYTFPVIPGRKFVRLHFYPTDYAITNLNINFTVSLSFFNVSVGSYIFLDNFSALLNAQAINKHYFIKEFSVHISSNRLDLTFAPSKNNTFAFVNGIQIVSMPQIFGSSDPFNQPKIVGTTATLTINENTAFETVARLNSMPGSSTTWLHFCEIAYLVTKVNMRVFDIFINNMTAVQGLDVIAYTNGGGIGAPIYLDFIMYLRNTSINTSSSQDVWVALHPDIDSKPELYDAELNGLEIFKFVQDIR